MEKQSKITLSSLSYWPAAIELKYKLLRQNAHKLVGEALKSGALPRLRHANGQPTGEYLCVDCNDPATVYEHRDYFKPLDVEPVCHHCNAMRGSSEKTLIVLLEQEKATPQNDTD